MVLYSSGEARVFLLSFQASSFSQLTDLIFVDIEVMEEVYHHIVGCRERNKDHAVVVMEGYFCLLFLPSRCSLQLRCSCHMQGCCHTNPSGPGKLDIENLPFIKADNNQPQLP